MRKAIQLFIEDDETQLEKEEALLPVITKNYNKSLTSFQRIVPSIYKTLKNHTSQHNSVFVNKEGEVDIVESSSGTVFYGLDCKFLKNSRSGKKPGNLAIKKVRKFRFFSKTKFSTWKN